MPVEPLDFAAEVTRAGRKVSIVEATITKAATGAVLARARALRIRSAEVPLPHDRPDLGPLLSIEPAPSQPADGRAAVLDEDAALTFQHGGFSAVLPGETHSFINPDLTIHLFRAPRGEWVGMASATHHSDHGVGMTDTSVFDLDGRVGSSNQSLLLDLR